MGTKLIAASHGCLLFASALTACVDGASPGATDADEAGLVVRAPRVVRGLARVSRQAFAPPAQRSGVERRSHVVRDAVYPMTVTLDETTVLCSSADYSATFLKVLIPGVAAVTLFDHRNTSVGAPCIAAGACTETLNTRTLLDAGDQSAALDLRVLLTGIYELDHDRRTCTVTLKEELFTTVRSVPFYHLREGPLASRAYEDCLGL